MGVIQGEKIPILWNFDFFYKIFTLQVYKTKEFLRHLCSASFYLTKNHAICLVAVDFYENLIKN